MGCWEWSEALLVVPFLMALAGSAGWGLCRVWARSEIMAARVEGYSAGRFDALNEARLRKSIDGGESPDVASGEGKENL